MVVVGGSVDVVVVASVLLLEAGASLGGAGAVASEPFDRASVAHPTAIRASAAPVSSQRRRPRPGRVEPLTWDNLRDRAVRGIRHGFARRADPEPEASAQTWASSQATTSATTSSRLISLNSS